MTQREWEQVQKVYHGALERSGAERSAYLDQACGDDPTLRAEIDNLLKAHSERSKFLEDPEMSVDFDVPANMSKLERQMPVAPDEAVGLDSGTVIGRYKLLQRIGEGGFGVVYMAEQQEPVVRKVAFKIIKLGMDTKQVIARFEAERQALAMMDHPNIAKVLDAGATETGRPYFVMELVRGVRITQFCDENQLTTEERLSLLIDVCGAIQHAHQKGIIHRDIKPSNVMITMHDDRAVPKVIDFGVAKATQHRLTERTLFTEYQQFIGTPAYMSPEQAQLSGLDIDTRSDIYSLGVLLYELLTDRTPFDTEELLSAGYDEIRRRIREEEPQKPSTRLSTLEHAELTVIAKHRRADPQKLRSLIRGDLDWIVMKALEKDRTRRYETANGFALDLKRYLASEPVLAVAPSTGYRLRKFARRNRAAIFVTSLIAVLLIGAATFSSWQAWRASNALKKAELARDDAELARENEKTQRLAAYAARDLARNEERKQRLISYSSDMRVAHLALEEGNLGHAIRLLKRYSPRPGREDLRGIEWRYLWQAAQGDELHTFEFDSMVSTARFGARGKRIAIRSFDGKMHILDVDSKKPLRVFDANAPIQFRSSLSVSPDGRFFASGEDRRVVVRDAQTWALRRTLEKSFPPLSFSPDSKCLAAGGDRGIVLWDTDEWRSTILKSSVPFYLDFSPDSAKIATAHRWPAPGSVSIWDVATGVRTDLEDLRGRPDAVRFSPDGRTVAVGVETGEVCVWNLETSKVVKRFQAHQRLIMGLAFSPNEEILATGGSDQLIHLWDTKSWKRISSFRGHLSEIWMLEFSDDGRLLLSASKDGTVRLWGRHESRQSRLEYSFPVGTARDRVSLPDGGLVFHDAVKRRDLKLKLPGGELVEVFRWHDHEVLADASHGIHSPDGTVAVFGKPDGRIVVIDDNGSDVVSLSDIPVRPLIVSPRNTYVLVVTRPSTGGATSVLWHLKDKVAVAEFSQPATYYSWVGDRGEKAAFSPDERLLAYGTENYAIRMWNLAEGRHGATLRGHTWNLYHMEFSPDGRLLVSSSWDGTARLWDVERGVEILSPFRGHLSGVHRATFSPDGRTIATSGDDHHVRLWSVATGQEMLSFPGLGGNHAVVSPSGQWLTWSPDRGESILVVTLPTLEEIDRELSKE